MATPSPLAYSLLAGSALLVGLSCSTRPEQAAPRPTDAITPSEPAPYQTESLAENAPPPRPETPPVPPVDRPVEPCTAAPRPPEPSAPTSELRSPAPESDASAEDPEIPAVPFDILPPPTPPFSFVSEPGQITSVPAPDPVPGDEVWSRLRLPLGESITIRPIGASRLMPGAMMTGPRDQVGPGAGIGFQVHPSDHWRLGVDLLVRAERLNADRLPLEWAGYVVPGVEYTPTPQAATPMYIGIVAPMSLGGGTHRQGVFFFIRWEEIFGRSKRRR